MAAAKGKSRGGARPKKGIGGRLPSKKSINLVLVDENKINPVKAALGILLIVALAGAFSKFLVYDRLIEVNQAQDRVNQLQATLDSTRAALQGFDEVEEQYAHYTYDGMTAAETGLVDRTDIVELVSSIIRSQDTLFDMSVYTPSLNSLVEDLVESENPFRGLSDFRAGVATLGTEMLNYREQVFSWSVGDNMLQVDLTGKTLESLNKMARQVEQSDIVNFCTLTTANKADSSTQYRFAPASVRGRFMVYLVQPPTEEEEVTGQ